MDELIRKINANDGIWAFVAVIFLVIGYITGLFRKIWGYTKNTLWYLFPSKRLPRETLRIVIQPHSAFWGIGKKQVGKRKKNIMHVGCDLYLTNITRGDILITSTYMKKPKSEASIPMVQASNSDYYGRYPILPGATTEGRFSYFLDEVVGKRGQEFIGDIVVVDQLGNNHIVKNIKFSSR